VFAPNQKVPKIVNGTANPKLKKEVRMIKKEVCMTQKMYDRSRVLEKLIERRITQEEAATALAISVRQVQRIYKQYQVEGIHSLVPKKQGKPSNNKLSRLLIARIDEIVTSERYAGFRPTLMCEKLEEYHGIKISHETARQIMIKIGVWIAHKEKRPVIHQQRQRRARRGELVQIDGSHHAWFEDRGKPCVLLVFIDDATGQIDAKFFKAESTLGYMMLTKEYIIKNGKPLTMYSDKHSVLRVNNAKDKEKERLTQFGRALKELEIQLLYANSPQAKGRVERVNQTLQDRLVKEMRLAGICTIEEGNKFLNTFLLRFNKKFTKKPRCEEDAHQKILPEVNLDRVFCDKEFRSVSKNLEFQYGKEIYQVCYKQPTRELMHAKITVLTHLDGSLSFEYKDKVLSVKKLAEQPFLGQEINLKELADHVKQRKPHVIQKDHPWLQEGRAEQRMRAYKAS
jgi:hypothetical protein